MRLYIYILLYLPVCCLGQQHKDAVFTTMCCLPLSEPRRKEMIVAGTLFSDIDSTLIEEEIKLAYKKIIGSWQLRDSKKTYQSSEHNSIPKLVVTTHGRGLIYVNDRLATTIQLELRRSWNNFSFPIRQRGEAFFSLKSKNGYLLVCDQILILGERMGDGQTFIFERMKQH